MERIILEIDKSTKKKLKLYAVQTDRSVKEVLVEGAELLMTKYPADTEVYEDVGGGGTIKKKKKK